MHYRQRLTHCNSTNSRQRIDATACFAHLIAVLRSIANTSSYVAAAFSGAVGLDRSCSSCTAQGRKGAREQHKRQVAKSSQPRLLLACK
jgi:hypothetical protein